MLFIICIQFHNLLLLGYCLIIFLLIIIDTDRVFRYHEQSLFFHSKRYSICFSMSKVRMSESNVLVKTLNDCPVVICLYITILITYGLVYFLNSDLEYLNFNVIDFYKKKQWWRLVSSTICHSSIAHLFICLTTLFEIRKIEVLVGSSFFLRNSVVVLVANRLIFSAIILIADYFTSRTLDNYFSRSFLVSYILKNMFIY